MMPRAELPDRLIASKAYSLFSELEIPVPSDLGSTYTAQGFDTWWNMWKSHLFRQGIWAALQAINPEYTLCDEEVKKHPNLCYFLCLWFSGCLILHHSCSLKMAQHHWILMESLSNTVLLPPSHFLGQALLHCQSWYWKPIHLHLQNVQGKQLLLMQRSQNMPGKFWLWRS